MPAYQVSVLLIIRFSFFLIFLLNSTSVGQSFRTFRAIFLSSLMAAACTIVDKANRGFPLVSKLTFV